MSESSYKKIYLIQYRGTDIKIPDAEWETKRVYYTLPAAKHACKMLVHTIKRERNKNPDYYSIYGDINISMFEVVEFDLHEVERHLL